MDKITKFFDDAYAWAQAHPETTLIICSFVLGLIFGLVL